MISCGCVGIVVCCVLCLVAWISWCVCGWLLQIVWWVVGLVFYVWCAWRCCLDLLDVVRMLFGFVLVLLVGGLALVA